MKGKIYKTLSTPFREKMDRDIPWNIYPRPQFKRDSFICLNGLWDFEITNSSEIPDSFTEKILVPFPAESELSGIARRVGKNDRLFYRRSFTLPEGFVSERLLLRFGAVDRFAKVYVNGKTMGIHDCGYTPFFVDITDALKDGENEIIVEVRDDLSKLYPYGKQKKKRGGMWYTPVSGIWQTVWLESVPENYIENIRIHPYLDHVDIEIFTKAKFKKLTLLDSGESFEFSENFITVSPKNIQNWTPENPYLYRLRLETETDSVESYFALRTVSAEKINGIPRLCLNGKPYLFNGLLDQGYYSDGIYTPATVDAYIDDIRLVKSMGFNTLRKHIKLEPMIFYYLCDSMGIAVFQDMVNNGGYSFLHDTALPTVGFQRLNDKKMNPDDESRRIFNESMEKTSQLLYNTPSVVYYTVFNEGWGQFCADDAYGRLKAIDGTRVIDTTSGWFRRTKSDVDSRHIYFKPLKPKKLDGNPLVISEFGGYAHRIEGHCFTDKVYGYRLFADRLDFENAVIRLYENEVKPLVEKGASAFIYTQVSDVEDETNGFVTYDRKVIKVDVEKIRATMLSLYE